VRETGVAASELDSDSGSRPEAAAASHRLPTAAEEQRATAPTPGARHIQVPVTLATVRCSSPTESPPSNPCANPAAPVDDERPSLGAKPPRDELPTQAFVDLVVVVDLLVGEGDVLGRGHLGLLDHATVGPQTRV
jgi:hypothetical protein